MDLKVLHSIMSKKGFHYFNGETTKTDNDLYITFSKLHLGKGDTVELRIGSLDNDIQCWGDTNNNIIMNNISDNGVFSFIEERF